jgi:hypothetical protein
MHDYTEIERQRIVDIARADQARERNEKSAVSLHAFLPAFISAFIDGFVADAKNYNDSQMSEAAKIDIDNSTENCLTLSRRAIAPPAGVFVTVALRDGEAEVHCTVDGWGTDGGVEYVKFQYILKSGGGKIHVIDRGNVFIDRETIVRQVFGRMRYYMMWRAT